jgi:hypothetical protein
VAAGEPAIIKLRQSDPGGDAAVLAEGWLKLGAAYVALVREDFASSRRIAAGAVRELRGITPHGELKFRKTIGLAFLHDAEGRSAYLSSDLAGAEQSLAQAVEERTAAGIGATDDRRQLETLHTWLALTQVRQGHTSDAARTIEPVVKFQRELAGRNRGDRWVPFELACALYVEALSDRSKRAALLHEAAGLIETLPAEMGVVKDVQWWRARVREARQAAATAYGNQTLAERIALP